MTAARTELLVFLADGPEVRFEGQIAGALERAESGGALRVVDVLVVGRRAGTGEVMTLRAHGGTGGLLPALADFRLGHAGAAAHDVADETARELAGGLPPGGAIVAVRVEHRWAAALEAAVAATGARMVAHDLVEEEPTADLARRALDAAVR